MCFTNHIKAHKTFCPCTSKSRTLCWDNLLITFTFGHLYPSAIFCHIGILVKLKFRLIAIFCYGLIVSILLCIYISSTCISAFKLVPNWLLIFFLLQYCFLCALSLLLLQVYFSLYFFMRWACLACFTFASLTVFNSCLIADV